MPTHELPQYSVARTLGTWALATAPMGILAWVVAPAVADRVGTHPGIVLWAALTAGLVWQVALCLVVVRREAGTLDAGTLRDRLWLRGPRDGRSGERRRRLWWWLLPGALASGLVEVLPLGLYEPPADAELSALGSQADAFTGAWWLLGLAAVTFVGNYFGEELVFRGVLLPRMDAAFGRWDWLANGVLFGLYHVHRPWTIAGAAASGLVWAWLVRRTGSAWFGVILHGVEGLLVFGLVFGVVLGLAG